MNYMDLTNEEILAAIELAKRTCLETGRALTGDIIEVAMGEVLNAKKNKEVENKTSVILDEMQIRDFMAINSEKITGFIRGSNAIMGYSRGEERIKRHLEEASVGRYKSDYFIGESQFRHDIFGYGMPDIKMNDLATLYFTLKSVNSLARENYYAYYKTASPDVLSAELSRMLQLYRDLKGYGKEVRSIIDKSNNWVNDYGESQVQETINRESKGTINNIAIERVAPAGYGETFAFPPDAYDQTFGYIMLKVFNTKGEYHSKREFDEADQIIDRKIGELEQMSVDDYRRYKIQSMGLSLEEQKKFDGHINSFVEELETFKDHGSR